MDDGKTGGSNGSSRSIVVDVKGIAISDGSNVVLRKLDTREPVMVLEDGTELLGTFEEAVGSYIVFSEKGGVSVSGEKEVSLEAHTPIRLVFRKQSSSVAT